jgi:hypothetical protein
MDVVLFALLAATVGFSAYQLGRRSEKRQIHDWLRFLQLELDEAAMSPLKLAAMISIGQHRDWEVEEEDGGSSCHGHPNRREPSTPSSEPN